MSNISKTQPEKISVYVISWEKVATKANRHECWTQEDYIEYLGGLDRYPDTLAVFFDKQQAIDFFDSVKLSKSYRKRGNGDILIFFEELSLDEGEITLEDCEGVVFADFLRDPWNYAEITCNLAIKYSEDETEGE